MKEAARAPSPTALPAPKPDYRYGPYRCAQPRDGRPHHLSPSTTLRVLILLRDRPGLSRAEVAAALRISPYTARSYLTVLVRRGLLVRSKRLIRRTSTWQPLFWLADGVVVDEREDAS